MTPRLRLLCVALLAATLAACGPPSKTEIVQKSRNIEDRAALEKTLGEPDEISKLGPVERWTYKAKDGEVVFLITGDTVALQTTNGK